MPYRRWLSELGVMGMLVTLFSFFFFSSSSSSSSSSFVTQWSGYRPGCRSVPPSAMHVRTLPVAHQL